MLNIPSRIYSKAIWETVRYRTRSLDVSCPYPEYDTRAISSDTAMMLARLVDLFKPMMVVEIGTGTGRSARAMSWEMPTGGEIHTCDTEPSAPEIEGVTTYHSTSTEMLKKLTQPVDLWFFDGRIQPEDISHIQRLSKPECIFLFDDFEGVEKGVANALMIQHLGGTLVLPEEGQTLGMMLRTKIGLVRQ